MKPLHFFLKNKIEVSVYPIKEVNAISIQLGINAGTQIEEENKVGTLHFLEHLFFKGNKKYPTGKEISIRAEELGMSFNASVGSLDTRFWYMIPENKFKPSLKFILEMITNPLLDQKSIDLERSVILSEQKDYWSIPENRFYFQISERWLGKGHTYLRRGFGYPNVVQETTKKDIADAYKKYYHSYNFKLSIAGKVDPKTVKSTLNELFVEWGGKEEKLVTPRFKFGKQRSDYFVFNEKRDQVRIDLFFPIKGYKDYDTRTLILINSLDFLLCGGRTSVLYTRLREDLGLVYSADSYKLYFPHIGRFGIDSTVDVQNLPNVLKETFSVLKNLKRGGFDQKHYDRASDFIDARTLVGFSNIEKIGGSFLNNLLDDKPLLLPKDYNKILRTITLKEVNKFLSDTLDFSKMHLSLMGDEEKIRFSGAKLVFDKMTAG
ncbi:insulinase family protein [Candidatus Woesebacteria bacterium]|nr:insulinase family protein [Candidatus Woesebacteria bacterium]